MGRRDYQNKRPSFQEKPPSKFYEIPAPDSMGHLVNGSNSYLRCYVLGECTVIVTKEFGRWHASISHRTRYPTWDEIAEARYRILPGDITAAMLLPPKSEYVNYNENCFQIVEVRDEVYAPCQNDVSGISGS
jgi:hypothetical protein